MSNIVIPDGGNIGSTSDTDAISISSGGVTTFSQNIDISGKELILDSDNDSSITSDTDDQIDFKTSGTDRLHIDSSGDIYSTGWTDYSGTTTVSGCSSVSAKEIHYKIIGKMLFFQFYVNGTSNDSNFSFTLPKTAVDEYFRGVCSPLWDNGGTASNGNDMWEIKNTSTVNFKKNDNFNGFTTSGTKLALGQGWYQFV